MGYCCWLVQGGRGFHGISMGSSGFLWMNAVCEVVLQLYVLVGRLFCATASASAAPLTLHSRVHTPDPVRWRFQQPTTLFVWMLPALALHYHAYFNLVSDALKRERRGTYARLLNIWCSIDILHLLSTFCLITSAPAPAPAPAPTTPNSRADD